VNTCIQDSRGATDATPPRICFDEPDNLERDRRTLEFLDACQLAAREAVVATVLASGDCPGIRTGDRLFMTSSGATGELLGSVLDRALLRNARASLSERRSRGVFFGDTHIWLEWTGTPTPHVVLEHFLDIDADELHQLDEAEAIFCAAAAASVRSQPAFESALALEAPTKPFANEPFIPELALLEPALPELVFLEPTMAETEAVEPLAHPQATGLAAAVAHVRAALRWSDHTLREQPRRHSDARKARPLGIDFDMYSSNQPDTATNPA
jgi:hypothetical protein